MLNEREKAARALASFGSSRTPAYYANANSGAAVATAAAALTACRHSDSPLNSSPSSDPPSLPALENEVAGHATREPPLISASIVLEELNEPLAPSPELAPTSLYSPNAALFTPAEQPLAEPAGASAAAEEPATAEGAILATAAVASAIESSKVEMEHKDASPTAREVRLPPLQPSGFPPLKEADRGMPTLQSEPYVPSGASLMYSALVQSDSGSERQDGSGFVDFSLQSASAAVCASLTPLPTMPLEPDLPHRMDSPTFQEVVNAEGITSVYCVRASPLTSPSSTRPHEE